MHPPTLVLVQSRGLNTKAASSAAVGSSGAVPAVTVPVATVPAAEPSSWPIRVALCAPLAGIGASASTIDLGITAVDSEYATWVTSKATPATIAALRITTQ
ncbi:hypothetical protein [Paraburkholderia sp. BL23I1N1]|uniref:hypothetical protein n=1 Tax=Paraburkholderia sp. BL23I1N1 TaxID=1938802 RepID=UPI0011C35190|nr:hypothetical protein [Paraburkholderia sp. BL23I1N1]